MYGTSPCQSDFIRQINQQLDKELSSHSPSEVPRDPKEFHHRMGECSLAKMVIQYELTSKTRDFT